MELVFSDSAKKELENLPQELNVDATTEIRSSDPVE